MATKIIFGKKLNIISFVSIFIRLIRSHFETLLLYLIWILISKNTRVTVNIQCATELSVYAVFFFFIESILDFQKEKYRDIVF